jgi:hypothetical protein
MDVSAFQTAKLALVENLGLSRDACHVYVGLILFLVPLLVLPKRRAAGLAWMLVLLAALAGEALDRSEDLRLLGYWQWRESIHDLWNTLFWPTVLYLLFRFRLLRRKGAG